MGTCCIMQKIKDKREDWIKKLINTLNDAAKRVKASTCERNIFKEIIKDVRKHFHGESNFWTNQQVLVMSEVFRGVFVKSWVALPTEIIHFSVCNKIVVREAVGLHSECWRERCKDFDSPEHDKISLNKEIKQIKKMQRKVKNFIMKDM